jgi:hypothetical protein
MFKAVHSQVVNSKSRIRGEHCFSPDVWSTQSRSQTTGRTWRQLDSKLVDSYLPFSASEVLIQFPSFHHWTCCPRSFFTERKDTQYSIQYCRKVVPVSDIAPNLMGPLEKRYSSESSSAQLSNLHWYAHVFMMARTPSRKLILGITIIEYLPVIIGHSPVVTWQSYWTAYSLHLLRQNGL